MVPTLCDLHGLVDDSVDEAVFLINAAGPEA
jgi:hypothetical protein